MGRHPSIHLITHPVMRTPPANMHNPAGAHRLRVDAQHAARLACAAAAGGEGAQGGQARGGQSRQGDTEPHGVVLPGDATRAKADGGGARERRRRQAQGHARRQGRARCEEGQVWRRGRQKEVNRGGKQSQAAGEQWPACGAVRGAGLHTRVLLPGIFARLPWSGLNA
eukprot:201484-Chlamydomonas_euryale.AAC.4